MKQKNGRVGNPLALCAALTGCALLAACVARAEKPKVMAPKTRAPQAAASAPAAHYGSFDISNIGQMQSSQSKGTGKVTVRLDGPNLSAKSPRYNIATPHLTILLVKAAVAPGKPAGLHAQSATATGRTTVTFRNPDQDETTTVTCDKAVYAAANPAKELGKLTMTGNVRSVTRGSAYGNEPLVQTWQSFYVEFADEDTINTGGEGGNISGQIREPAPRERTGGAK